MEIKCENCKKTAEFKYDAVTRGYMCEECGYLVSDDEYRENREREADELYDRLFKGVKAYDGWHRDNIARMVEHAKARIEENGVDEDHPEILDWLVNDHHGIYVGSMLLRSIGLDVPDDAPELQGWWDFVDEVLEALTDSLNIEGCYIGFTEGGIALMYGG